MSPNPSGQPRWHRAVAAPFRPSKLYSLDWTIGPNQTYDVCVDDIYFLDCK